MGLSQQTRSCCHLGLTAVRVVQSAKMKVQKYSGVRPDPNPIGPPQQPAGPSGPNGTPLGPQGPAGTCLAVHVPKLGQWHHKDSWVPYCAGLLVTC